MSLAIHVRDVDEVASGAWSLIETDRRTDRQTMPIDLSALLRRRYSRRINHVDGWYQRQCYWWHYRHDHRIITSALPASPTILLRWGWPCPAGATDSNCVRHLRFQRGCTKHVEQTTTIRRYHDSRVIARVHAMNAEQRRTAADYLTKQAVSVSISTVINLLHLLPDPVQGRAAHVQCTRWPVSRVH